MKNYGGTWSGSKALIAVEEALVVGGYCTYQGRIPDQSKVSKIVNWGACVDLSDVRAFLGTAGLVRMFIKDYGLIACPLQMLTRKGMPFAWGEEQEQAME